MKISNKILLGTHFYNNTQKKKKKNTKTKLKLKLKIFNVMKII